MVYYEETNPCDIPLERVVKLLQNHFPNIDERGIEFLDYFQIFFKGAFMGIADMLPGISGGTIALVLGIYHQVLNSIRNINFKCLFRFQIKDFFLSKEIKFLSNLFIGALFSFLCFSKYMLLVLLFLSSLT